MSSSSGGASTATNWAILRAGAGDLDGLEVPSLPLAVSTAAGPVRLAVGSNGEARLLVPLEQGERIVRIESGDGLALTESLFTHAGLVARFLDITCLARDLEPVFGEVVDEVVARMAKGMGGVEAVRTTLDDFRALLSARSVNLVDRSRIAGLVAELVVLTRLLEIATTAWRAWRGPLGDRHDFRVADRSIEVKASLRAASQAITIHGVEQLEPASGGSLHIAHFVLEPVSGAPLTVAILAERALAKADDPPGLQALLSAIGCPDIHAQSWNWAAYRLERESVYRVEGTFPRIVPSGFRGGCPPPGVSNVSYVVDLSHASSWRCPSGEFESLLRLFANDASIL